jgi:methylmalonyl-CoA epimerase
MPKTSYLTQVLKLDHIGIACTNLQRGIAPYKLAFPTINISYDKLKDKNLDLAMIELSGCKIEIISPIDVTKESAIKKFLSKNGDGAQHHISFAVKDIDGELKRLKDLGYKVIDSHPYQGGFGKLVAFLHPSSFNGVLVELCQV